MLKCDMCKENTSPGRVNPDICSMQPKRCRWPCQAVYLPKKKNIEGKLGITIRVRTSQRSHTERARADHVLKPKKWLTIKRQLDDFIGSASGVLVSGSLQLQGRNSM